MPLLVKKLESNAIIPTVSNPNEDLGFDLYAVEDTILEKNKLTTVRTNISARYVDTEEDYDWVLRSPKNAWEKIFFVNPFNKENYIKTDVKQIETGINYGLLYRDRSSMALKGITVSGGVIDAGYTGELKVLLTNHTRTNYTIKAGDKIVQMIPTQIKTNVKITEVNKLPESRRTNLGFGSTGR